MPSTPADTYGLLRAAIQDPNPVVFIENRLLYGMKGPQPPADHIVPIGTVGGRARRAPTSPSCRSRGWCTRPSPRPRRVAGEGISVEVIDLRTVAPLDMAPILESVHKTSRLLIAHEAVVPFGIGAEIAATVARDGFWDLDAPIERIGAAADAAAVRARARTRVAARPRRHRRRDPPPRHACERLSSRGRGRSRGAGSRWCLRRSRAPMSFSIASAGLAPLRYQRDSCSSGGSDYALIANATNSNTSISSAQQANVGDYLVVVSNTISSATSASANSLSLISAP